MNVKCNKCGYVGDKNEFPKDYDFCQQEFIKACPKCDNRQSPGDASLRMMPGQEHPFEYVRDVPKSDDPATRVFHDAGEAS